MTDHSTPHPREDVSIPPWYRGWWWQALAWLVALTILLGIAWRASDQARYVRTTATLEQGGAHEVYTLNEAMTALGRLRGITLLNRGGDATLTTQANELYTEFRLLVRGILAEDHVRGFRIADSLERALARVQTLLDAPSNDPVALFDTLGEVEFDLTEMMRTVADFSNLTLDADGSGHYLMDLLVYTLPALSLQLDNVRGLSAYASQSARHNALIEERLVQEIAAYARDSAQGRRGTRMLREHDYPNLTAKEARLEELEKVLMESIAAYVNAPQKSWLTGRQHFDNNAKANTMLFDLYNEVYGDLHSLLELRLEDAQRQIERINIGIFAATAMILALIFLGARRLRRASNTAFRAYTRLHWLENRMSLAISTHSAAPSLALTPTALTPLLQRTVDALTPTAGRLGVEFEMRDTSPSTTVRTDATALTEALQQILHIAIERTPTRSAISLSTDWIDVDRLCIVIKDYGPPITDAQQDRLFDPQCATPGDDTLPTGANLALVFAKRQIERLHGQLDIVSDQEPGATYFIELPATRSQPGPTPPSL